MTDIHLRKLDDWTGLYINGGLVYEGHSLPAGELLGILFDEGLLTADYDIMWEKDQDILEEFGYRYPKLESELGEHIHD